MTLRCCVANTPSTRTIYPQRKSYDCGVAALATYVNIPFEDVYAVALACSSTFQRKQGTTVEDLQKMAKVFSHPLKRLDYRRVDLEEHNGILAVNWHRSVWKRHGCRGHWVVLRNGLIIDPSGGTITDAEEYLTVNRGTVGTLLQEK